MKYRIPLTALLGLVLIAVSLLVRLVALGQLPLTPAEAATALEAARWVDLGSGFWDVQSKVLAPGYHFLTGTLIVWFGAQNLVVRLVPALFGAALAALPLALNRKLSWPAQLLAILLLSFSTASLTASRTAGSLTMAVFGLGLAAVQASRIRRQDQLREQLLVGLGLGLALAAGSYAWQGVFGIALAYPLSRLIPESDNTVEHDRKSILNWRVGLSALVSAVLLSTGFGVHIEGLSEMLQAPGNWLLGWTSADGWPFTTALAIPFVYDPLVVLVGGYGAIRALSAGSWLERRAALWGLGALLAYLLYPGRSPGDLLWVVLPMTVLAAGQIERVVDEVIQLSYPISSVLLALVLLIVVSFAYLMLESSVAGFGLASLDRQGQLAFAVTALAFAFLLILLFGIGWSWHETLLALGITMVLSFAMLSTASAWGLNFTEAATQGRELWRRQVSTRHLPLLEDTLADIAKWQVGRTDDLQVQVQGEAPASLAWILRHHQPAEAGGVGNAPPVILAPETALPRLPADYMGQAFAITEGWGWPGRLPTSPLGWLLDRRASVEVERWILFVRMDVAQLGLTPALQEAE